LFTCCLPVPAATGLVAALYVDYFDYCCISLVFSQITCLQYVCMCVLMLTVSVAMTVYLYTCNLINSVQLKNVRNFVTMNQQFYWPIVAINNN